MEMNYLATIITYNPDIDVLEENIQALYNQVSEIIIIDNNSSNLKMFEKKISSEKISIIKLEENKGIAYALNQALQYAEQKNYEWLLTMDQDSKVDNNMVEKYSEHCQNDVAQLSPLIVDLGEKKERIHISEEKEEVGYCISSGCLMNVKIAKEIGGFDNKLFIDYVDQDYSCINAKLKVSKND